MKIDRLIVVLLVVVPSVLITDFVTEMLSYVGANGYGEKFTAEHILERYPIAGYWAKKYLEELEAKQCQKEKTILEKAKDPGSKPSKPRWQCTNCGEGFKTGEEYAIHGLGDCSPGSQGVKSGDLMTTHVK